jgi:hypothetical protein
MRLSPLDTSATNWPIVPAPNDEYGDFGGNENWQGKPKYSEKTFHNATFFTTTPIWFDLGLNPNRLAGKQATNRLSYGTVLTYVTQTKQLTLKAKQIHWLLGRSSTISKKANLYTKQYANTYGPKEFSYEEQPPIPTSKSSSAFNPRLSDPFWTYFRHKQPQDPWRCTNEHSAQWNKKVEYQILKKIRKLH